MRTRRKTKPRNKRLSYHGYRIIRSLRRILILLFSILLAIPTWPIIFLYSISRGLRRVLQVMAREFVRPLEFYWPIIVGCTCLYFAVDEFFEHNIDDIRLSTAATLVNISISAITYVYVRDRRLKRELFSMSKVVEYIDNGLLLDIDDDVAKVLQGNYTDAN